MFLSKKQFMRSIAALGLSFYCINQTYAEIQEYRFEYRKDKTDSLKDILSLINHKSSLSFSESDFRLVEDRFLANTHFKTYVQYSEGLPIHDTMVRSWSNLQTGELVQLEAHVESINNAMTRKSALRASFGIQFNTAASLQKQLNTLNTMDFVKTVVLNHSEDREIKKISYMDEWNENNLERIITVVGRRGIHKIVVSHFTKKIISAHYTGFPTQDVRALVYPIYEQTEKEQIVQKRVPVILKNISDVRKVALEDPYKALRTRSYRSDKQDPDLGNFPAGREFGYWSWHWLSQEADKLANVVPETKNSFDNYGVYLVGKYATVNIHPDALYNGQSLKFAPMYSTRLAFLWKEKQTPTGETTEIIPKAAYYGFPLLHDASALKRPARILPDHNPISYLEDGFDEVQVYYAVDTFMESLHKLGFTDPELSTRPFNAFLYDPDISMRDNAYYSFDTITFTTYSPGHQNFARDNSTIWHELGHGIMARLMGQDERLQFTGESGLSEGMADFVAQLIVEDVTKGVPFAGSKDFRIINKTGFHFTNEEHDAGEAYGGAMQDILMLAIKKWGHTIGLQKVADLTLDTMRLTRNHPAMDVTVWFTHLFYADKLGSSIGVRAPKELNEIILSALASRNFSLDDRIPASMTVLVDNQFELTSHTPGSRYNNLIHYLNDDQKAEHDITVTLEDSEFFQFRYPVTLEVQFKGGPIQGAVKWENEEQGSLKFVLQSSEDVAKFKLTGLGCHYSNRDDGSCSDYAYMLVKNNGEDMPVAKKRLYLRLNKK